MLLEVVGSTPIPDLGRVAHLRLIIRAAQIADTRANGSLSDIQAFCSPDEVWRTYGPTVIPLPRPSWRSTAWLRRNSSF